MTSPFVKQSTRSFKFKVPGDRIDGEIVSIGEQMQQPKFNKPGEFDFWPSGDPIMQIPVTWQTGLNEGPDDNGKPDDGRRTVFFTISNKVGGRLAAMQDAIRAAGASDLEVGARSALWFESVDPESKNPDNPRKIYGAEYAPPAAHGGAFGGGGTVTPSTQQQQAAAQASQAAEQFPQTPQGNLTGQGVASVPPTSPEQAQAHGQSLREQYVNAATNPPATTEKEIDTALVSQMVNAGADDATIVQVTGVSPQALAFVRQMGA